MLGRKRSPLRIITPSAHVRPPGGQLLHRVNIEVTAVVEEPAVTVEQTPRVSRIVAVDATPQGQIVAACYDGNRVHLERFKGSDRIRRPLLTRPATARPKPLPA